MGIVNQEVFVAQLIASNNNPTQAQLTFRNQLGYVTGNEVQQFDRASALAAFNQVKDCIKRNGYLRGKYLRPWEIDPDLYAGLDRAEPWWGFEFEVGFNSRNARANAIEHCWNTWDNVTFDSEGEGAAPVEITFQPEERSKYQRGESKAQQFIAYMEANRDVQNDGGDRIGTHINMSSPKLTPANHKAVIAGLQRTIAHLPMRTPEHRDVRMSMVGRSRFYGSFFGNSSGQNVWIEGKLFRTAYTIEAFNNYVKVSDCLTKCLDAIADALAANNSPYVEAKFPFISNLYEMWKDGAEPVVDWDLNRGNLDGMRGNDQVNGLYARDRFVMPERALKNNPRRVLRWCDTCNMEHE